jgi:hypothetical protein
LDVTGGRNKKRIRGRGVGYRVGGKNKGIIKVSVKYTQSGTNKGKKVVQAANIA